MKKTPLSKGIVVAIGIGLSLLAVGLIGFLMLKPTQEEIAAQQAVFDANYNDSTPQAQDLAKKDLAAANVKVQEIKQQWAQKQAALMPPFDVGGTQPSDRFRALRQITYELTHYLGPDLERQMKTTGVTSTTKFTLPAPPVNPNDITNGPIVIPLGAVAVNGDFRQVLTHVYDWQYFNRLVVVDNLALHGNSPYMQGTYNATLYIFPQNADTPAPLVPNAPKAGGTTGTTGP